LKEKLSYKLQKAPVVEQPAVTVTSPKLFVHPDVNSIPMEEYLYLAKQSPYYAVREYPDKGKYEGELIDEVRHGYGAYYYPSGNIFIGQWVNGMRNGKGIYDYTNGRLSPIFINNVKEINILENGKMIKEMAQELAGSQMGECTPEIIRKEREMVEVFILIHLEINTQENGRVLLVLLM
jgi:hypothetical protein